MSMFDIPTSPPPGDYLSSLDTVAPGFGDAIAQSQKSGESWIDTAMRVLPVLVTTVQQRQVINAQIEQARAGRPPLDLSTIAPQFNVGISPDTKTLLIGGGLALAALLVLPRVLGRR